MNEHPLVCICVPTYNSASTVRETLTSILAQSYPNLVVHVSDNASTDNTVKMVESLADPRITIHRNESNIGAEANFNRCIQLSEGQYTAIFHADDFYEPEMVAKQVSFLERHPDAGGVFTEATLIDENGKSVGKIGFPGGLGSFEVLYDFRSIFKALLKHSNFLVCPSAMVRTEIYQQEIQSWRGELFKSSSDLDVWLRMAQFHSIGLLPLSLMRYRVSSHQFSAKVRVQTSRADFFLVMDYYLAQEAVQAFLNREDIENYARLERRDRVMRAVNCVLTNQVDDAKQLLVNLFSLNVIKAGLQSRRGLGVLAAGVYLKILLLLRLEVLGRYTLGYMKRVMRK